MQETTTFCYKSPCMKIPLHFLAVQMTKWNFVWLLPLHRWGQLQKLNYCKNSSEGACLLLRSAGGVCRGQLFFCSSHISASRVRSEQDIYLKSAIGLSTFSPRTKNPNSIRSINQVKIATRSLITIIRKKWPQIKKCVNWSDFYRSNW